MTQSYNVRDASLISEDALPASTGAANGTALDLGTLSDISARVAPMEMLLSAPVLNATLLPNGCTCTYKIEVSNASNFATNTTLIAAAITQTGANGAAASTYRFKIPSDCKRYIRAVATTADNGNTAAGNCAAKKMTLEMLF
jgi:hypothetical protein